MRYQFSCLVAMLMGLGTGGAQAGEAQQQLETCLIQAASPQDRDALLRWTYLSLSTHPLMQDLSTVTRGQRDTVLRDSAAVFERLMIDRCGELAAATIFREGDDAFGKAFETLAGGAMEQAIQHPAIDQLSAELVARMNTDRLAILLLKQKVQSLQPVAP